MTEDAEGSTKDPINVIHDQRRQVAMPWSSMVHISMAVVSEPSSQHAQHNTVSKSQSVCMQDKIRSLKHLHTTLEGGFILTDDVRIGPAV